MSELDNHNNENNLLASQVVQIIREARQTAYRAVNFTMVLAYWNIGKLIVEDELHWERADYGTYLIKNLSKQPIIKAAIMTIIKMVHLELASAREIRVL